MSTLTELAKDFMTIEKDFNHRLEKRGLHIINDFHMYNFRMPNNIQAYIFVPIIPREDDCYVYIKDKFVKTVEYSDEFIEKIERQELDI